VENSKWKTGRFEDFWFTLGGKKIRREPARGRTYKELRERTGTRRETYSAYLVITLERKDNTCAREEDLKFPKIFILKAGFRAKQRKVAFGLPFAEQAWAPGQGRRVTSGRETSTR